jgi:hypothetical protein
MDSVYRPIQAPGTVSALTPAAVNLRLGKHNLSADHQAPPLKGSECGLVLVYSLSVGLRSPANRYQARPSVPSRYILSVLFAAFM